MSHSSPYETLLIAARSIAADVAAKHAADVDAQARFPSETVQAMKDARLLSAVIPREFGGAGCSMHQLGTLCSVISGACGSSGMVLAMHYIQAAVLARHCTGSAFHEQYMRDLSKHQYLLASITSEVGTFGDTRSSICAVEVEGDRFRLVKEATTGSYCAHADAILVTCRANAAAAASDQVLVMVKAGDYTLTQTSSWDPMGMRGTCSPGFRLESSGPVEQIIPGLFADSASQTMVPYSHILWSALWWGISANAVSRAGAFVRGQARKTPDTMPPTAILLAEVSSDLQAMRNNWQSLATEFDDLGDGEEGREALTTVRWALRFNMLKVTASEAAPKIVHQALQIVGLLGYKNDSPFSVGRHYRDVLSASIMISNERIAAKSAKMLLILKDD